MSLLQRLTASLRPGLHHKTPLTRPIPTTFFYPHSVNRTGLGQRLFSSRGQHRQYNYARTLAANEYLLYGIMGLNSGIFVYSSYLHWKATQGFPQDAVAFMRNMSLNFTDFSQGGYYHTAITSVFNHSGIIHLGFNMLSTYYLGGMVAAIPGMTPMRLLTIIIGSGLGGSAGWLAYRYQHMKNSSLYFDRKRGLGFSGAVTGLGVVAACWAPSTSMLVYGIIPMPLWAIMLGFIAYDGYYVNDNKSTVAHAGHLGGAAFGALYFLLRMRRGF